MKTLFSAYSDFAPDSDWVHYSDKDFLSINYDVNKQSHQDISGIYFFPPNFKPFSVWSLKKYRITAKIKPSTKVLDLVLMDETLIKKVLTACGCYDEYAKYINQYPPTKRPHQAIDMAWEQMQRHFALTKFRAYGEWNKIIRKLGYDAIFDDTRSIHSSENQLIVLNPKVIYDVKITPNKIDYYGAMKTVYTTLISFIGDLGVIRTEPIKKQKNIYSDRVVLSCNINIHSESDDRKHLLIKIEQEDNGKISIRIPYAPSNAPFATYDIFTKQYEMYINTDWKMEFRKYITKALEPEVKMTARINPLFSKPSTQELTASSTTTEIVASGVPLSPITNKPMQLVNIGTPKLAIKAYADLENRIVYPYFTS